MAFSRVNPVGWGTGTRLTHDQMNQLDTNVSKAIDGSVGALEIAARSGLVRTVADQGMPRDIVNWTRSNAGNWSCTTLGGGQSLYFKLRLPHGSTLTSLTAYYRGSPGHAALPATMPGLRLDAQNLATGAVTFSLVAVTDSSPNVAAFEAWHTITLSGLSYVISRTTEALYAVVTTEANANAQVGPLVSTSLLATFSMSKLDETGS